MSRVSDVISLREQVAQAELEQEQYNAPHQRPPGGQERGTGRSVYQCTDARLVRASRLSEHALTVRIIPLFLFIGCEVIMRITAIAIVSALISMHVGSAAAQNFDERWSIIPKAHAEPAPKTDQQNKPDVQTQPPTASQGTSSSQDHAVRSFSGKASFYSYPSGKTASGLSFDRNLPTAAHRSLPFGTRVRVTNIANQKSVVVVINDRGPKVRSRVLDLSLDAARTLGITDRGVVDVRGEVL